MFAALAALLLYACTSDGGSRELPELPPLPEKVVTTSATPGEPVPLREAIVALTGAVRGEVEVCGCPTTPYGGFARRAALYRRLSATGVPFFPVDAGEMLVKGLTGRDESDRRVRAEAVLDLAEVAGLDAWAASPVDLRPGGAAFLQARGALAANWSAAPEGPFLPARIVEHAGVRLGFVGLAGAAKELHGGDPVAAVRAATTGDADAWFVLSNADEATNRAVAEGVPGLAAVLSTEGDRFDEPRRTAGAPVVEAPGRGRYVTLLHVSLGTTPRALDVVDRGIWKDVALARTARSTAAGGPAAEALAKEAHRDHARLERRTAGRAVVYVDTVPLTPDLEGDPTTSARLDAFKRTVLAEAAEAVVRPTEGGYGTGSACGACHRDRLASWAFDGHARAVESLEKRGATDNPECIGCHSTGFGRPGGFATLDRAALESFRDVQCEACHGPMRGHDGHNSVRSQPVTETTCRTCHDEANSPAFDYVTYRRQLSCVRLATQGQPDEPASPGR